MVRREQLTYDVGERSRRSIPWPSIGLLAGVVVLAVQLVGWVVSSGGSAGPAADVGPQVSAAPSATPRSEPSGIVSPTVSPAPIGTDEGESDGGPPTGSVQAATSFVWAWLDRDPKTRRSSLAVSAVPGLTEQLLLTDPANIPVARPAAGPVLEDSSTYSVQFVQALTSGMKIRVYLVADPQARHGWSATSVEEA